MIAYAAQIAAQLGAHIIKVKPPTEHIEQDAARKVYEKEKIPVDTLADRVRHVAEAHQGSVHVRSEPGRGATFTLILPILPGSP